MLSGRSGSRICSSYVTTRFETLVPGIIRVLAPVARMQLSNVTVRSPTRSVCASVNSPRPWISVIPFFFIRKCTPLTRPSATLRLRWWATAKSKVTFPSMPKVCAWWWKMCASSALRSSAFDGMQPTLRQTPPQYLSSTIAVVRPS